MNKSSVTGAGDNEGKYFIIINIVIMTWIL